MDILNRSEVGFQILPQTDLVSIWDLPLISNVSWYDIGGNP